jgi:hypothetical protein
MIHQMHQDYAALHQQSKSMKMTGKCDFNATDSTPPVFESLSRKSVQKRAAGLRLDGTPMP